MYDNLVAPDHLVIDAGALTLTNCGRSFVDRLGVDVGALGTPFLNRFFELGWAKREPGTRIVNFSRNGETEFNKLFPDVTL